MNTLLTCFLFGFIGYIAALVITAMRLILIGGL